MDITVKKLMELFVDTLNKVGANILTLNEKEIEYNIFEEFNIGAISFLHENSLLKLKENGLITEKVFCKSIELRCKYIELENTDLWNIDSVKSSIAWKEILDLSDEIKLLLTDLGTVRK